MKKQPKNAGKKGDKPPEKNRDKKISGGGGGQTVPGSKP